MSVRVRRNGSRNPMLTTQEDFDLSSDHLDDVAPLPRTALLQRLEEYRILPPAHDRMPTQTLELIEQLFVTWFELADDASRRAALTYLFATEADVRAALLAIVPLYYDAMFFDEFTPTRDLVELALLAHAKWRHWLMGQSAVAS